MNYAMNVFPCSDVSGRVRGKTLSVNGGCSIIGHRLHGLEAVNTPPPCRGPVGPAGRGRESSFLPGALEDYQKKGLTPFNLFAQVRIGVLLPGTFLFEARLAEKLPYFIISQIKFGQVNAFCPGRFHTGFPDRQFFLLLIGPRGLLFYISTLFNLFNVEFINLLWRLAAQSDSRIEPIPCGELQWREDTASAMVEIARREGQEISLDDRGCRAVARPGGRRGFGHPGCTICPPAAPPRFPLPAPRFMI